jgi:hypothetical protein
MGFPGVACREFGGRDGEAPFELRREVMEHHLVAPSGWNPGTVAVRLCASKA